MVGAIEPQLESDGEAMSLLEECGALLYGEFTLASGRVSDYYFDSKQLTMHPEGAKFVAQRLLQKSAIEGITVIGGTPYSAIPIASQLCLYSSFTGQPIPAFYMRKATKGYGREKLLEGKAPGDSDVVAFVDDVVTTGDSLLEAIDMAERESGRKVAWAFAVLDRDEGGREKVEARGIKFWSLFTVARGPEGKVTFRLNEP